MPRSQIELPGGCWCSALSVFPKNWKDSAASLKAGDWYISYRFYEPDRLDAKGNPKGHQLQVKGMNDCKTWLERKAATKLILEDELDLLQVQGWNPRTKNFLPPPERLEVSTATPMLEALQFANRKLEAGDSVKGNLKSILTHVDAAARKLNYHKVAIGDVWPKHFKAIFELIREGNDKWTNNTYNHYRKHISFLFPELIEWGAVRSNPVKDLKKKKHLVKLRETLSDTDRVRVANHLASVYPAFLRLCEIFYCAGIRETELLALRYENVDLVKERIKITVYKRSQPVEEWREIKVVAMELWREQMTKAKPGDYVFSHKFRPGKKKVSAGYITDQWATWVKRLPDAEKDKRMQRVSRGIGITADFYAFKHLHTTEARDLLEERMTGDDAAKEVANHNGHTTTAMVNSVYDKKARGRKGKLVKMLPNTFVKKAE